MEKERESRRRKEEQERILAQKREEQRKKEAERRAEQERIEAARKKKRNRRIAAIICAALILLAGGYAANKYFFEPQKQYMAAEDLLKAGDLQGAVEAFSALNGYRDSHERVGQIYYDNAIRLSNNGQLEAAKRSFMMAGDYADAAAQIDHIDNYLQAEEYLGGSDYLSARPLYASLGDFLDAPDKLDQINETLYGLAAERMNSGDISGAYEVYSQISDYSDSAEIMAGVDADYQSALDLWKSGDKQGAEKALTALIGWSDVSTKLDSLREEIADEALDAGDYDIALDYYGRIENASDEVSGKIEQATQAKAYNEAIVAFNDGDLETALSKFVLANNYADAATQTAHLNGYLNAVSAQDSGNYDAARSLYASLGDYLDAETRLDECNAVLYDDATAKMENGDVEGAYELFGVLSGYSNSAEIVSRIEADYSAAAVLLNDGKFDEAAEAFALLNNYSDSETQINECKYQKAGSLANSGNYGEAADIFDELAGYRDSSDKANEAHYNNANALWSAGDLQAAAQEFKNLGDYSDAPQQLVKISTDLADYALANGDYASALTAYLRLEQTDEIKTKEYELAQACYDDGHYAEATSAYETLGQYELSLSKLPIARYAWANQLFNEGGYAEAAEQFALLGDMTDSAERAQESTYLLASQQLEAADYDTAKTTFLSVSGYNDADSMAQECDYRKADALLSDGSYADAQAIFEALGKYSDSATKAEQCVYEQAEELFAKEDYAGAKALYATISYSDSADKVNMITYAEADALYSAGNYSEAEALFNKLGEYNSSADRAKGSHLQQGVGFMEAGKYEEALDYLETVDYSNSAELAAKCHYEIGHTAMKAGDMDTAMAQYALATELPEAQEALMATAKDYASINEIEKAIQVLWLLRDNETALNMLKEIGDLRLMSGDTGSAMLAYCAIWDRQMDSESIQMDNATYKQFDEALQNCSLLPAALQFDEHERYAFALIAMDEEYYDLAMTVFESLLGFEDSQQMITETIYRKAKKLNSTGSSLEAFNIFNTISDYKDVQTILQEDENILKLLSQLDRYSVGKEVKMGGYGSEITWTVIAEDGYKRLLLSNIAVTAMQFGRDPYESSPVRAFLIGDFYNAAFSEEEKATIVESDVAGQGDKVFILGAGTADLCHVSKYICRSSKTAEENGIRMGKTYPWWGLKTKNNNGNWQYGCDSVLYVYGSEGASPTERLGVRPAIWIDALAMLNE